MSQIPNQAPAVATYTPTIQTTPPGSRISRVAVAVVVAIVLVLASFAIFPGMAAQAIRGSFPPVHAVIAGVPADGTLHTNQSVTFSATQSTGTGLTYAWSFSDGQTAAGPTVTRTFDQPTHQMTVSLMVSDALAGQAGSAHQDSTTANFTVYPNPPTAQFAAPQCFSTNCDFDASTSSSESQIQEYDWDFGDSNSSSNTESDFSSQTYHDFSAPGTYTVTLTVKDDYGQTAQTSQQVTVTG